ncbi:response regulator transcription factor [Thiorhodovibrio litoralis]|uniref:response regulator transcription factor n=1 Tax=Thiorhodovibrio litoralis TaxID=2952932 RepID=UPI003899FDC9|nr:hypothetical protein [Thiorhodovibrio winogradskyi]
MAPVYPGGDATDCGTNVRFSGLLAEGLTALEIANPLFISLERVPSHRRNLMRRLGLRNKVELIRLAIEHKIEGVR